MQGKRCVLELYQQLLPITQIMHCLACHFRAVRNLMVHFITRIVHYQIHNASQIIEYRVYARIFSVNHHALWWNVIIHKGVLDILIAAGTSLFQPAMFTKQLFTILMFLTHEKLVSIIRNGQDSFIDKFNLLSVCYYVY